jgi:hypothetical protein
MTPRERVSGWKREPFTSQQDARLSGETGSDTVVLPRHSLLAHGA